MRYQAVDTVGLESYSREFVARCVDPYMRDVHQMLLMPPGRVESPAFNISIAQILCSVIAGVSRVAVGNAQHAGEAFREVCRAYPTEGEPEGLSGAEIGAMLWDIYRNSLSHSLGLHVEWNPQLRRQVISRRASAVKVGRLIGFDVARLFDLERPAVLLPTIGKQDGKILLCPESLFWGVRKLIPTAMRGYEQTWQPALGMSLFDESSGTEMLSGTQLSVSSTSGSMRIDPK